MKVRNGIKIALGMLLSVVTITAMPAWAEMKITTLSSRPEMVSGGDALVKIELPEATALDKVSVTRNGADVTKVFKQGKGHFLVGLVDGLKVGKNQISAKAGDMNATLTVTDYPITGPIFSGPHESPFLCETVSAGLGEPLDCDCSIETTVEYYYVSTSGKTNKLSDPRQYPSDLATTTVLSGRKVPYIVRVESGTINRGIYQIAILDDPIKARSDAYEPNDGWNGRLQISFAGGSGIGHHQGTVMDGGFGKGSPTGGSSVIAKGYATATSSLLAYSTSGNDTLVAETAMMLKEHFIKTYGVPVYTIGSGGSGGAMLQHLVSQNYPGILDAIMTTAGFPCGQDLTWVHMDAALLLHYFEGFPGGSIPEIFPVSAATSTVDWTEDQMVLVSGYNMKLHGLSWSSGNAAQYLEGGTNPVTAAWPGTRSNLISEIPEDLYNPVSNPTGIRATSYDTQKNQYGTDPATGFAYRALSNVGQQYGLTALNGGKITVAQFLDLNENIGGFDKDGYFQKDRTRADDKGVLAGYATGRKFMGYGVNLPILDLRGYGDLDPSGDTHLSFHSFQTKMRLIHANGTDANRVMWTYGMNDDRTSRSGADNPTDMGLEHIDQWLLNIISDKSADPYAKKVIKNKPSGFVDGFWDEKGTFVSEQTTLDQNAKRNQLYPIHGDTIIASGSPIEEEATECTLKSPLKSDYKVSFTDAEWTRLKRIFKEGVCDYTKPGVHADVKSTPWLSYGPAPQIDYKQE